MLFSSPTLLASNCSLAKRSPFLVLGPACGQASSWLKQWFSLNQWSLSLFLVQGSLETLMEARNQLQRNHTSEHRVTLSLSGVHKHHFLEAWCLNNIGSETESGANEPRLQMLVLPDHPFSFNKSIGEICSSKETRIEAPSLTKGALATQRQVAWARLSPKVILSSPKPARAQSRWASLPPFMRVSDLWRSLGCSCGRRSLRCSCQTCSFTRWSCTWPPFASYSFSI